MRMGEEKMYSKCRKCNGDGYIMTKKGKDVLCKECGGTGKLTWLENIFGKNYYDTKSW